jgi:hypothetical protein
LRRVFKKTPTIIITNRSVFGKQNKGKYENFHKKLFIFSQATWFNEKRIMQNCGLKEKSVSF